jgi:hypothetical protein
MFYKLSILASPALCMLVALLFLVPSFVAKRKHSPGFPVRAGYLGASAWTVYGLNEAISQAQHANIRIDVLFLWPILLILTAGCIARILLWLLKAKYMRS